MTESLKDWFEQHWPAQCIELVLASLAALELTPRVDALHEIRDTVAAAQPSTWTSDSGDHALDELTAFAAELAACDGLAELVGRELARVTNYRNPGPGIALRSEEERDARYLDEGDAIGLEAAPFLDERWPSSTREVAAWLAGGYRSRWSWQVLTTLLGLAKTDELSGLGEYLLDEIEISNWTSVYDDTRSVPRGDLIPEILEYLMSYVPSAQLVSLEQNVWNAALDWYPAQQSWEAALAVSESLRERILDLFAHVRDESARSGNSTDDLLNEVVFLSFIAFDAMLGMHRLDDARSYAARLRTSYPGFGNSRLADELEAVLEALDDPTDNGSTGPPPDLLRHLIDVGCYRAAIYLTIAHFVESPAASGWPSRDEVTSLKLAFNAAVAHWGRLAARGLYPIVRRALEASNELPVDRIDDLSAMNEISRELVLSFDAQAYMRSWTAWSRANG